MRKFKVGDVVVVSRPMSAFFHHQKGKCYTLFRIHHESVSIDYYFYFSECGVLLREDELDLVSSKIEKLVYNVE